MRALEQIVKNEHKPVHELLMKVPARLLCEGNLKELTSLHQQ